MTDIVERLRRFKTGCDKPECERMIFTPLVCDEAAAEIERLRVAMNILQAAMTVKKPIPMVFKRAIIDARAELEGK